MREQTSESGKRPLNVRLRDEAAEWDEGETIPELLREAADAVETLAAHAAINEVAASSLTDWIQVNEGSLTLPRKHKA